MLYEKIIRRPEVEARIGLSRSTIYSMMDKGEFPRPIKLGRKAVGWLESDINDWLESRKQASESRHD